MAVIVPPGQAGVVVLFGTVREQVLPSGLHFINPFSQVVEMEVRTRNYTMSGIADEGQKKGDDSIPVITSDGLTVKLDCHGLLPPGAGPVRQDLREDRHRRGRPDPPQPDPHQPAGRRGRPHRPPSSTPPSAWASWRT
jgi:hypothetical protein